MPDTPDDFAVRAVISRWIAASKAGDLDTIAALMTEDAIFLVPGRAPFGRTEFLAASNGMASVALNGHSTIEELQVAGGTAYVRSKLDLTITPRNGAALRKSGYALSIFHKSGDGQWRLARDANLLT